MPPLEPNDIIVCPGIPCLVLQTDFLRIATKQAMSETLFCVNVELRGSASGPLLIERDGERTTTETFDWDFEWSGRIAIELLSDKVRDIIAFGPNPAIVQPVTRWTIDGQSIEVMGLAFVMPVVAWLQRSSFLGRDVRVPIPTWRSLRE